MTEAFNGGPHYMRMVDHGVQMNLNAALYGLVTPPRRGVGPTSDRPPYGSALSRSLPKVGRHSPPRFYAGAKFGERPPPTQLPKPPTEWVRRPQDDCDQMTHTLKVLLKVQP